MKAERHVEIYAAFRANLPTVERLELAPYPRPFEGGSFNMLAMPFHEVAQDSLRELANAINDFRGYIQRLATWMPIYGGLDQDEQFEILIEHIRPLAILALGSPYSIRGRLIHATCATAYHANRFLSLGGQVPNWSGEHSSWKDAEKVAKHWKAWPMLREALGALNSPGFTDATRNFRNDHHHGHPASIGLGHVSVVRRVRGKPNSWSFDQYEPLDINSLLEPLSAEHRKALEAFSAYVELVFEQHNAERGLSL